MISATDVYTAVKNYSDVSEVAEEQLIPCCEDALDWVVRRLKDGVSESDPLITKTAAAIAHFFFFIRSVTEPDKYESFKVGDMTVKRNPHMLYEKERDMRLQALADAAPILKDGGFSFCGC